MSAAAAVGAANVDRFTHGTTIATNALLERRGARTALVTNEGFEHVLHLRRQTRAHLYRPCVHHSPPLVPLERCVGVRGRTGPDGELVPLDLDTLPPIDAEAIAVSLLFSFRDAEPERRVAAELRRRYPSAHVVASHEVAPEFREYERASTTAVDAYLGPVLSRYLRALGGACADAGLAEPLVMRSSGGLATLEEAAEHAAFALLSGPAAGVVGAAKLAALAGFENALSFDMGGTSTDVCAIVDGEARREHERLVDGLPIRLPTLAVHTVGAGGGSIVRLDEGGALRVGPESAGADPGPACYGRGGDASDGNRREPSPRTPAVDPARRDRARRGSRRARAGRRRPLRRDRRRERGDGARAARRLGRAGSRPARLRARRVRRRRATARVRARGGARDANRARAGRSRGALRARPRRGRRAARRGAHATSLLSRTQASSPTRERPTFATSASRSSSPSRSVPVSSSASTKHTRRGTATPIATARSSSSRCERPRSAPHHPSP